MSLRGGIFNGAVNLFDDKLQDVLFTLVRQGLCEGEVTLKVSIDLARKEIIDEAGMPHDVDQPYFAYSCTSSITQKDKVSGAVAEQLKLRKVDGQLELRDLDENTLFDIVEGWCTGWSAARQRRHTWLIPITAGASADRRMRKCVSLFGMLPSMV